jgi:hypothetical protein
MKAGRELDALVAEKVMGNTTILACTCPACLPTYSTTILAALAACGVEVPE